MRREVIISIKGNQDGFYDEQESVEFITEGHLYKKNDNYYIIYKESEVTGLTGTTTLKIEGKTVTLTRSGKNGSHLVFEEGRKHLSHYDTGLGIFNIGVSTQSVGSSITDTGGELTVDYTLEINNELTSKNKFYINVREAMAPNDKPYTVS